MESEDTQLTQSSECVPFNAAEIVRAKRRTKRSVLNVFSSHLLNKNPQGASACGPNTVSVIGFPVLPETTKHPDKT